MVLSEELREQFAQQHEGAAHPETAPAEPAPDPEGVLWRSAIQLCGLAGLLFLGLVALSKPVPPVILLAIFWFIGAPIVVIGVYAARNPSTRITTRFGAATGLLSGLSISLAYLVANIAVLLVKRFVLHQGAELDASMQASLDALRSQPAFHQDPSAAAEVQSFFNLLKVPEYLAGFTLLGSAFFSAVYTLYSTVAGAFAGLLRSRARPR